MKVTEKYLEVYRDMMFEYLKINNENAPSFDKSKTRQLRNELAELYLDFENEYQNDLINFSDNNIKLRSYVMKIYVCGFYRILCIVKKDLEPKNLDISTEIGREYLNFRHAVSLICSQIREYLIMYLKVELPIVNCDKYNISGNYFGDFEIILPQNNNEESKTAESTKSSALLDGQQISKKAGRRKSRRSFTDLIINKNNYRWVYEKNLRQFFIENFKHYNSTDLAKLAKSLEELGFFKINYDENNSELYAAFINEFKNDAANNGRGFRSAMKEKEADKVILQKLKDIGFKKLEDLKK
jgi:hypothetical protein